MAKGKGGFLRGFRGAFIANRKLLLRVSAFFIALLMLASFACMAAIGSQNLRRNAVRAVGTSARAMCTIEAGSGRILYTQNADQKLSMASTTKIVTAITVIENCDDIDALVTVHPRAIGVEGTSIYLQKGEKLTVRELLLGLMLRSGNDAAAALALNICPPSDEKGVSVYDGFNKLMLQTAVNAGAENSSFKNPHGLDEEGHYTTARDLALISAYAMRNPTFREIVSAKEAKISGVDYPRVMRNKNRLLHSMKNCVGIKTGFTKKAGRCYVGAIEDGDVTLVTVVLNCGPMFEEAASLMNSAAREFSLQRILTKDEFIDCANESCELCGIATKSFFYPLRSNEKAIVRCDGDNVCVWLGDKLIYTAPFNRL